MANTLVVYWSGTGNTQTMATAMGHGLAEKGTEVDVVSVSDTSPEKVLEYDKIAFGCPSMGDEVLEESEFEPLFTEVEGSLSGKKVALFGSYGWGDGQWMREWAERTKATGAKMLDDGFIQNEGPDEAACEDYGRKLADF